MTSDLLQSRKGGPLEGRVRLPGDKSISHRALILGALAQGETTIEGLLESADVLNTARALQALGAAIERTGERSWRVRGPLAPASGRTVDCGNSGTGARLLMGALAGFAIRVTIDGDASLRSRPMRRVMAPLAEMGARFEGGERLPLTLAGGDLKAISYELPVPSAQVKSAVLLAGLNAAGTTTVIEPEATRDHTERMLAAFGAKLQVTAEGEGRRIELAGGQALRGCAIQVPGDPSSAAFPLVAALVTPGSQVTVEAMLMNPSRIGLIETLREMGADITVDDARDAGGETVAEVKARHSALRGVEVPAARAPSMIDEYPILAVAAAFADGRTLMRGLAELRVKESDRLALMAAGLEACGVEVEEEPEGLIVRGHGRPPRGGAVVESHGDHRISMAHLVLGLASDAPVTVDGAGMIGTSFPDFTELMSALGAGIGAP
jgi:3-phosphoshikimate 1-carboxyvinyltransferase